MIIQTQKQFPVPHLTLCAASSTLFVSSGELLVNKKRLANQSVNTDKTRAKPRKSTLKPHTPFSSSEMKDSSLVSDILLDCIKSGDLDSFREVLSSHLITANKMKFAENAGIGRRTLYDILDPSKKFNPELETVSAIFKGLTA